MLAPQERMAMRPCGAYTFRKGDEPQMGVTIKDIAKEVGLSVSAVSLVLNNRPCRISAEKKEQIFAIAKRRHYIPNQAARSLVTKESRMLALILPDIENTFFSSLAKRIEDCCRREGYMLLIANSNDSYEQDKNLLRSITARGVDGLFMIVSNESYQYKTKLIQQLKHLPIPYVMVDRIYEQLSCDKVLYDNEKGAYLAVRHLQEHGHTRIGCVVNTASNNGMLRLKGYKHALEERGIEYNPCYVTEGDYRFESGYEAASRLLETDITAAFVSNDMMAIGFLKKLYELGRQVPKDFSLVGYDNSLSPFVLGVKLTSVAQDPQLLGEEACRLLTNRLKDKDTPPSTICLPPQLVIRSSVEPPLHSPDCI